MIKCITESRDTLEVKLYGNHTVSLEMEIEVGDEEPQGVEFDLSKETAQQLISKLKDAVNAME